ncbi:MAG TPA: hypothetical protein VF771_21345 [Longimicrobiaceae bacterium]
MYTVTPLRIVAVLLVYAGLFSLIHALKPRIARQEQGTALLIGGCWAVGVFIANYLLFRAGVMSFLPWINNFLHTFVWIGGCLTVLYLGVGRNQPMWVQFVMFATLSLVVKVAERILFGTWELGHFFHVFQGNAAYILGWSLADGLYPPITYYGLKLLGRRMPAPQAA